MPAFEAPLSPVTGWTLSAGTAVLPASARYPGRRIATLAAAATADGVVVVAPAAALIRVHDDGAGGAVLELEPVPFPIQRVLAALGAGLPSFYVGVPGVPATDFAALHGQHVDRLDVVRTAAAGDAIWIGVLAQDRIVVPAATWTARIRAAMAPIEPSATWDELDAAVAAATGGARAPVFVLDGRGRPLAGATISVTAGAGPAFSVTLAEAHGGDLQRAIADAGRPGLWASATAATLALVPAAPSQRWVRFGSGARTDGSAAITPADPHVLVTDLDTWFAAQHVPAIPATQDRPAMPAMRRYTGGNRIGFFIDGGAFFADLVAVARGLSDPTTDWLMVCGWGFTPDFKLGPRIAPGADAPTLVELLRELARDDIPVRLLVNRFIQLTDNELLWAGYAVLVVLSSLLLVLGEKYHVRMYESDAVGIAILIAALAFMAANIYGTDLRSAEPNAPIYDAANAADLQPDVRAVWSRNPVTIADNPHAQDLPVNLAEAGATHFGVYHMKSMVARTGETLVAWTGGMDLVDNRRDDARRLAESPYHDVQARIEGPAAEDVAQTLRARWIFDAARETDVQPAPAPSTLLVDVPSIDPLPDGPDIAQIARTYPRIDDPARQLWFAPQGDFTTHDTILQAIARAREFIYIEDQYFTPNALYREALFAAIPNIERLVIILPTFGDQPLGDLHRREFVQQLNAVDAAKVIIRAPVRRPTIPISRRRASHGRLVAYTALSGVPGLADQIAIGPDSRLPKPPFWLVIDGESMLATEQFPAAPGDPASSRRFRVLRGTEAAPGLHPRAHEAGAAAAIANRNGIYVHAKVMVVDDLFLSIGSANINRRGLRFDGEGNVFTVPEALRRSSANVARAFRIEAWAAHLDLPLPIAAPLLHDPIRASALFLREYERGNRAVDLDLVGLENVLPTVMTPGASVISIVLASLGIAVTTGSDEAIWRTLGDPTTVDL